VNVRAVLAIDPGGSKTEALLVGLDGAVLGWGRSRPAAADGEPHPAGYGRTGEAVRQAVMQAVDGQAGAELHVGMINRALHRPGLEGLRIVTTEFLGEHVPAFTLSGETHGVMALAGTGAMVYARDPAGRCLQLDGLGPLLGDYGSGFSIGLKAIQAAARQEWHPRRATTLADAIYAVSRPSRLFSGRAELVTFMLKARDRAQIAAFAALVDQEARKGDPVATGILEQAARDIAETVRDATARLELQAGAHALIGVGSVMMRSDLYWQAFTAAVAGFAPALRPVRIRHPAVAGGALHVLARLAEVDATAARRRLFEDLDRRAKEQ
jgi:N-acetylglucosamine kinase-like BadF-type ATPase